MQSTTSHSSSNAGVEKRLLEALDGLPGLVRACHARMGRPLSPEDLEEATQETGLAAWRQRDSFRGDSGIETWLYGIARFTILNQLNRARRIGRREPSNAEECLNVIHEGRSPISVADTGLGRLVRENLAQAGDTAAAILCSHEVDGMTFVEISENLSMKEATVKSRYYRALPGLKDRLRGLWLDSQR
ncbi:MAG: RNA polymerase sigma factor [Planctomycetota bacterium]